MSLQDEAYELGLQWSQFYEPGSPSRTLIAELMDTCLLVNVVHNSFKEPDAIFTLFFNAGEAFAAQHSVPLTNGYGH
jgi:methylenetetrahydrofolate reductase (NADPH)